MAASMCIINDKVYGLANDIDIDVNNAKVVGTVADNASVLDAQSISTMAYSVNIRCRIDDPIVNTVRKHQSEDHPHDVHTSTPLARSGSNNTVPRNMQQLIITLTSIIQLQSKQRR